MANGIDPAAFRSDAAHAASGGGNLVFVTLVSLVSAMGGFLFGYETVVIAGTLAPVKAQFGAGTLAPVKAQFGFSAIMEGWFVSSGLLGCVVGVLAAGRLCDGVGRQQQIGEADG